MARDHPRWSENVWWQNRREEASRIRGDGHYTIHRNPDGTVTYQHMPPWEHPPVIDMYEYADER